MMRKIKKIDEVYFYGISQQEVADYLGISRPTLSTYKHKKGGHKTLALLPLIDLNEMVREIKYKQLLKKIDELEGIYPDWIDQYLYNSKKYLRELKAREDIEPVSLDELLSEK